MSFPLRLCVSAVEVCLPQLPQFILLEFSPQSGSGDVEDLGCEALVEAGSLEDPGNVALLVFRKGQQPLALHGVEFEMLNVLGQVPGALSGCSR